MRPTKPPPPAASGLPVAAPAAAGAGGLVPLPDLREVLVDAFLRGKDPKTVRAYRMWLLHFREWIEAYLKLAGALPAGRTLSLNDAALAFLGAGQGQANFLAHEWKASLIKDGYAPSSINGHLVALRSMVRAASLFGVVPWTLSVDNVPLETYRDTLGPGMGALVAVVKALQGRTDDMALRDQAIIALLHDAGLRRDELVSLDIEHVDWAQHRVWARTKKRTARAAISVNPDVEGCLKAWIRARGDSPGPIFTNFDRAGKGSRLSGRSISRITSKYGLGHAHGLRHLAITEALNVTNGNIREVMKFSRHRDPKTVMIYDDNRKDVAGKISKKLSRLRRGK
jgi:integrase/recombinase XerC